MHACSPVAVANTQRSRCRVPAAKPGRESIDLEIFGMAGIPEGATPGNPLLDGRFFGMQQRFVLKYRWVQLFMLWSAQALRRTRAARLSRPHR